MFRILGEGEPETLAEPHKVPRDMHGIMQRGRKLEPLNHATSARLDRPGSGTISAYQPRRSRSLTVQRAPDAPPADSAAAAAAHAWPQAVQQQLAVLDHQMSSGSQDMAQMRRDHARNAQDVSASKEQLQALTEMVHGLQQSAASSQV